MKRPNFDGHFAVETQRFERIKRTRCEQTRQSADWREASCHDEQHQHDRHGHEHAQRPQCVQRQAQSQCFPHRDRLRDLDEAIRLLHAEYSPMTFAPLDGANTGRQTCQYSRLP